MRRVKIGAAALNQTPLDWGNNLSNIYEAIAQARAQGVTILCLPEMCITGYGCEDQFHSPDTIKLAFDYAKALSEAASDILVSVGLPVLYRGALYNCSAVLINGEILGLVPKKNLANDGVHYEHRWFKPWPEGEAYFSEEHNTAIGDLRFNYEGIKVGFEICEDAWAASRVGAKLAADGVDVILNPSASHFAFRKYAHRVSIVSEGSRSLNVAYIYANLLGNESGRTIYDGDTIIANNGMIVANGPRFSYEDVVLTSAVVDLDINTLNRMKLGSYKPNLGRDDALVDRTVIGASSPFTEEEAATPVDVEFSSDYYEFTRAVTLGMFDYMRKTRSNGFVVSLSGGADSSAAACLVRLIPVFGRMHAEEVFEKKISYTKENTFLTCIYQPTENSSDTTRMAAYSLANELKAKYIELDVDSIVKSYTSRVERALGQTLTWEKNDHALQNIQARARAPGAWMVANINNAILLATSNRSEAAVGYATMDGDTCGGLSPLAGIDKDFLLQWLIWVRREFNLNALDLVIKQKPTAELRPAEQGQDDESDLMPYDLLDMIEGLAIRDKKPPVEVFKTISAAYNKNCVVFDNKQLGAYIEKFFTLWSRNQWKRERYAPSFHLDDKNLDPKSWCRFPILSGGFATELKLMWEHINHLEAGEEDE